MDLQLLKAVNRKQHITDHILLLIENCDIMLEILNKLNPSEPIRDPDYSDVWLILLWRFFTCPCNYCDNNKADDIAVVILDGWVFLLQFFEMSNYLELLKVCSKFLGNFLSLIIQSQRTSPLGWILSVRLKLRTFSLHCIEIQQLYFRSPEITDWSIILSININSNIIHWSYQITFSILFMKMCQPIHQWDKDSWATEEFVRKTEKLFIKI